MLWIIIIDVLLWAVVILGIPLALVRWKTGNLDPPLVLTVLARATGTITLLLGSAHFLELGGGILSGRRAYDLRNVEMVWIGGILMFSGLVNLLASGGLRRGERRAWRISGAATIFVWLFTLSLIPLTMGGRTDSGMNRGLFSIHSLYLLYWATHRLKAAASSERAESAAVPPMK
jgi:hypothetical protein